MSAAERAPSLRNSICFGGWLAMPEPPVIEVAVRAGFDRPGLDTQRALQIKCQSIGQST
jgi:2-keto-3-deoxy-L-rhamnonate aldolase RhmA